MNLTIIGSGYVGLTTGTCFAEMGHHVICVDNNREKIRTLQSGSIPIYEPKLEDLIRKNVAVGRLEFSPDIASSIPQSDVIFIAVPTPPNTDGSVDLTYIEKVAREIAEVLKPEMGYKVIVDKSTVPVKTGEKSDRPSSAMRGRTFNSTSFPIRNSCGKVAPWTTFSTRTASSSGPTPNEP